MPQPFSPINRTAKALVVATFLCACSMAKASTSTDVWSEVSSSTGIPQRILHAIALAESGKRWSDGSFRPWPYTLNSPVNGSQFFNDLPSAVATLRALRAAGVTNIDIGIMQINCAYHCSRVNDPAELLDPIVNVRVAGQVLAQFKAIKGDLAATVGAYHAGLRPDRAERSAWYQNLVASRARQLTARGRA